MYKQTTNKKQTKDEKKKYKILNTDEDIGLRTKINRKNRKSDLPQQR